MREALDRGDVRAPAAVDEAWGDLGAALADARQEPSMGGRALARATRSRSEHGTVALGPDREALSEAAPREPGEDDEAIVMVSGCLGLIYLTASEERLTLEQIAEDHPRLIETLAAHPGIAWVMVRSREQGAVVLGAPRPAPPRGRHGRGRGSPRRLRPDRSRPPPPPRRLSPLPRHPRQRRPTIPSAGEIAPFEEFMGSHGGLGGPQTKPFAVIPTEWSDPATPIVGVEAMHAALMGWMAAD